MLWLLVKVDHIILIVQLSWIILFGRVETALIHCTGVDQYVLILPATFKFPITVHYSASANFLLTVTLFVPIFDLFAPFSFFIQGQVTRLFTPDILLQAGNLLLQKLNLLLFRTRWTVRLGWLPRVNRRFLAWWEKDLSNFWGMLWTRCL